MKKLLFLLFILYNFKAFAQNIPAKPNPARLVNDFANVLTADQVQSLEQKLVSYDDSTSNQIVIVTVPTTGDYDVDDYALKILRDWGVGSAKNNNGIVILAAITDRKIKIEVGYGLEGAVPDIVAKEIIENYITPNFKEGNFYRGFDAATTAIIRAATGEYKAPAGYNEQRRTRRTGGSGLGWIIPIIVIIILFSSRGGGGGGGMMSRRGYNPFLGGLLGGMLGGNLGRGGGGGWSGGGDSWSGGGGGGGFGGFGGGSGGGGGASGSW